MSAQAEIRNPKAENKEICEFGAGRPDFGGRWPRGEALGPKKENKRVPGLGDMDDQFSKSDPAGHTKPR